MAVVMGMEHVNKPRFECDRVLSGSAPRNVHPCCCQEEFSPTVSMPAPRPVFRHADVERAPVLIECAVDSYARCLRRHGRSAVRLGTA